MQERAVSVLVVDDEAALIELYCRALTRAAYRCIGTQNGKDALDRLTHDTIDVVISDLAMPGMSGLEFMRRARELDPDLPILVVTGAPGVDSAIESIDAGVFRYLTKPVSPSELVRAVGDAVHARALAQARRAAYAHMAGNREAPSPEGLMRALDLLWLAVQPIVDPLTKRVVAYEALMRTHHPQFRDPAKVLAAADTLDMHHSVGRAVRAQATQLVPRLPSGVDLFVNIHPLDLLDDQLFAKTGAQANCAERVVLELTERASLEGIPDARARVAELKSMGYRVALDDMGAGYAGLATFAMLKPNFVKMDLSLVRDVDSDPMKQTLLRSIVGLARELGISVIAEGIETHAERQTVSNLGCGLLQGYLFARPAAPFPTVNW